MADSATDPIAVPRALKGALGPEAPLLVIAAASETARQRRRRAVVCAVILLAAPAIGLLTQAPGSNPGDRPPLTFMQSAAIAGGLAAVGLLGVFFNLHQRRVLGPMVVATPTRLLWHDGGSAKELRWTELTGRTSERTLVDGRARAFYLELEGPARRRAWPFRHAVVSSRTDESVQLEAIVRRGTRRA